MSSSKCLGPPPPAALPGVHPRSAIAAPYTDGVNDVGNPPPGVPAAAPPGVLFLDPVDAAA